MFKLIIISTFLALTAAGSLRLKLNLPQGTDPREMEDLFNQTLVEIAAGLAQYDPFTIPTLDLNIEKDNVNVHLQLKNTIILGISDFVATKLNLSIAPPSITMALRFQNLQIITHSYNLDMQILFIPFYGSGSFSLGLENFEIEGTGGINLDTGISGFLDLQLHFNVPSTALQITGLLNNREMSTIVSTSTTECFPVFFRNYGVRLGEIASPLLEYFINSILAGEPLEQLLPVKGELKTFRFKSGNATINARYQF